MTLLPIIPLAYLIYSDYKSRQVPLWVLLLFLLFQVLAFFSIESITILDLQVNVLIVSILLLSIYVYLKLRKLSINKSIGAGDVIFLFSLTFTFRYIQFNYFLIIAFLLSLIFIILYNKISKRNSKVQTIPLISTVGFCYVVYQIVLLLC